MSFFMLDSVPKYSNQVINQPMPDGTFPTELPKVDSGKEDFFGENIQAENQLMELALMKYQNDLNQSNAREANEWAKENATIAHDRTKELLGLQQAFNAEEARKVRDWNAKSYQRTMRDMKAAGLNPILAYSQGAAITGGQAATSGFSNASQASTYMAAPAANPDMDYYSNTELKKTNLEGFYSVLNTAINAASNVTAAGTTRYSKVESTSKSTSHNTNYNYSRRMK